MSPSTTIRCFFSFTHCYVCVGLLAHTYYVLFIQVISLSRLSDLTKHHYKFIFAAFFYPLSHLTADNKSSDSDGKGKYPKPSGLRNVFALGLVSFSTDFSTEMVLGVLPLFVINNLGASRDVLGTMEGSAELISYASRMISGSLSENFHKRKIFVLIGYGLSAVSKPFLAFSASWVDAFVVRAADRVGKGMRTAPRDALIADSVSISISGKAFGIHRTIDQSGAILGPIAAFAILQVLDIQWVFLFSLIPGAVAVFILIFYVKEVMIGRDGTDQVADIDRS
jgi:hypothetical protein